MTISPVPHPRPPYLQLRISRHGKQCWYVRVQRGPLIRLRAPYGSRAFMAEYEAALAGKLTTEPRRSPAGTLQWLWDSYRQTANWQNLSETTRYQRDKIMDRALREGGQAPFGAVTRNDILDALDRRASTPAAARNFLKAIKGLFQWAEERQLVTLDPTASVKYPKAKKGGGFAAWTREDVDAYQARWPIGTRQRVWLDVILYTGLRRGDLHRVGKQHARNGVVTLRTQKGGETITVTLPILAPLQATLEAGPIGDLAWCCGEKGGPLTAESMGNAFAEAARMAGVQKSAHGVRKIAATIAAENGATAHELMAIFGWLNIKQAEHYTREAERARLSAKAMEKLDESRKR